VGLEEDGILVPHQLGDTGDLDPKAVALGLADRAN
jgi:hypothetical protein